MVLKKSLLLTIWVSSYLISSKSSKEEVKMVLQLFRHGARNPITPMPTFEIISKRESYKDLTTTGMRNLFNLGKLLRLKYPTLFSQAFNYNDIEIVGSSNKRTTVSVISHLQGIYEGEDQIDLITPDSKQNWIPPNSSVDGGAMGKTALPGKVNFFAMDIMDQEHNFVFKGNSVCSGIKDQYQQKVKEINTSLDSTFSATYAVYEKNKYLPDALFEDKKWSYQNALELGDTLLSKIYNDFEFSWNYELLLHTNILHTIGESIKGGEVELNKVANFKLFEDWLGRIEMLENHLNGSTEGKLRKAVLYSAHDSNITLALSSLFNGENVKCMLKLYTKNVENVGDINKSQYDQIMKKMNESDCGVNINFASNITIEFYTVEADKQINNPFETYLTNSSPEIRVRFWFNNMKAKVDDKLDLSVKDFKKKLKDNMTKNFIKDCGAESIQDKNPEKSLKLLAIISLIFAGLVIFALLILILTNKKKKSNNSSLYHSEENLMGIDEKDEHDKHDESNEED